MTSRMIAIVFALLLAACAKPLEVGSITEIKAPPGASGVDVYAAKRAAGEKVPDFKGEQIVEVRSYTHKDGEAPPEIAGAQCKLTTHNYSAEFVTPAKVRVPRYHTQSSPLAISCTKEGFKPKLVEVGVYNSSDEGRIAAGSSAGLTGLAVSAIWNAVKDDGDDVFAYRNVRVDLEPVASVRADAKAVPNG